MWKIRNENGKTNKENRIGKYIDSAMVRRNEKFYGYGKEKKEDERIGDDRRVYSVGVCIYGK